MDYAALIKNYARILKLDTLGFCSTEDLMETYEYLNRIKEMGLQNEFEQQDINKRINTNQYIKDGKTIISIAFPYLYERNYENKDIFFSKYTIGQDYHLVVKKYLDIICKYIRTLGGNAVSLVDSNDLPERYVGYKCGVGFIGKNGNIITEKYGSYVFLGEIITDLVIDYKSKEINSKCGECELCIKSCPGKCLSSKDINNYNNCISYITQKKHITDKEFFDFKGRMFGCDTCQDICPYNNEVIFSEIQEFQPFEFMKKLDINELVGIDNKIFKEKYAMTSAGWRGKNLLQRNAMINMLIQGYNNKIINTNSPYVNEYYHRLLKLLHL